MFKAFKCSLPSSCSAARSYAEIAFYKTFRTPHSVGATRGPSLRVLNNATTYTCLNLVDVFSTNHTAGNATHENATVYELDNITYVRSANSYDISLPYTEWYVNQYPIEGNGSVPAPMQVNVYGESDCRNDTHPYFAHSCRSSASGHLGDWSAKSISLQPNDINAASCLYNASNGVPESEENAAGGHLCAGTVAIGAAIAMAFAMVL